MALPGPGQQIGCLRKSPTTPRASIPHLFNESQSAKTSLGNPTHTWFLGSEVKEGASRRDGNEASLHLGTLASGVARQTRNA